MYHYTITTTRATYTGTAPTRARIITLIALYALTSTVISAGYTETEA